MFKCEVTGKFSQPGDKINRIVVKKRPRVYHEMRLNEETERYEQVEVGRGWEIEKEIIATDEGVRVWKALNPDG